MFKVTRSAPDRLDIEYSGKLDRDAMNTAIDELVTKMAGIENGKLLFQVGDFELPTFEAIGTELSRASELFGLLGMFSRCAVLAEQRWLKLIAQFEGALVPGVEIKGFGLDEHAAAEAWLGAE
jgi:hypothetical protein